MVAEVDGRQSRAAQGRWQGGFQWKIVVFGSLAASDRHIAGSWSRLGGAFRHLEARRGIPAGRQDALSARGVVSRVRPGSWRIGESSWRPPSRLAASAICLSPPAIPSSAAVNHPSAAAHRPPATAMDGSPPAIRPSARAVCLSGTGGCRSARAIRPGAKARRLAAADWCLCCVNNAQRLRPNDQGVPCQPPFNGANPLGAEPTGVPRLLPFRYGER